MIDFLGYLTAWVLLFMAQQVGNMLAMFALCVIIGAGALICMGIGAAWRRLTQ